MKSLFCLFALLCCTQAYAEPKTDTPTNTVEWKEETQPDFSGKSEIQVLSPISERDQFIELDFRFTNDNNHAPSSSPFFFNAFFQHSGSGLPAVLSMFDEKHKFVRNLTEWVDRSRSDITADDWSYVPTGAYVGTHIYAVIQLRPSSLPTLQPGTYYLQLIYNESFISPRPRNEEELAAFRAHGKWNELFRSNTVKIEISPGGF